MPLPEHTTVLIAGAGPVGMACALSLLEHGIRDFVIVDGQAEGENTSRATVVHAATLETLEQVHVAGLLANEGIHAKAMNMCDRKRHLIRVDFASLTGMTRYPYALILPQHITEAILHKRLQELGVQIIRPLRVVGMREDRQDSRTSEVVFDNGESVRAKYIVGADGSHSTVRDLAGVGFRDPDGAEVNMYKHSLGQMLFADVVFADDHGDHPAHLPTAENTGVATPDSFYVFFPFPIMHTVAGTTEPRQVYRIGGGVPQSAGAIPHAPNTEYLQAHLDKYGPTFASSDPRVNPRPIRIAETIWSSRFRTRAAIADTPFVRKPDGAAVLLIGDAAHIHSPAGGQGMNLGLRDAIALGATIAAHTKAPETDDVLTAWAKDRHARAGRVIALTNNLMSLLGMKMALPDSIAKWFWWFPFSILDVRDAVLVVANKFQFVRTRAALAVSGIKDR